MLTKDATAEDRFETDDRANGDGLCAMVITMKDKLVNYSAHGKERGGKGKTAANWTGVSDPRSIADPLAAEQWSLPASTNPFPPY